MAPNLMNNFIRPLSQSALRWPSRLGLVLDGLNDVPYIAAIEA